MHRGGALKLQLFLLLLALLPFSVHGQNKQICVGELIYPKGDSSGGRDFRDDTIFTISIGSTKVKVGKGESKVIELPESVNGKYISIKKNNKPYSSIKYRPMRFKSARICMWLYWPHATWQLYDYEKGKWGCNCF